jgi:hypothetical protein
MKIGGNHYDYWEKSVPVRQKMIQELVGGDKYDSDSQSDADTK